MKIIKIGIAPQEKIRECMPDCDITTDVMVGFPGETDQDFQDTHF